MVNNILGATTAKIHGEIVSWSVPLNTKLPYTAVVAGLTAAGLDAKLARELKPRDAFARACRELQDARIIRRVAESAGELKFQFTKEEREGDRLRYDFEAVLTLDKVTGTVRCDAQPALAARAEESIKSASDIRSTNDITRLIQKLFDREADLFQVRDSGGCYFVPAMFIPFVEKVDAFLAALNGSLRRFPIPAGYAHGDRSVAEAVRDGIDRVISEHVAAVGAFDDTVRDSTLEKTVERINTTRFKVECYKQYLGDMTADLDTRLAAARQVLRQKVSDLGRTTLVPEPAEPESTYTVSQATIPASVNRAREDAAAAFDAILADVA